MSKNRVQSAGKSVRLGLSGPGETMGLKLTLALALLSLVLWIVFAFVLPVGIGAIHVLFALGATLLVRWYALKYV